MRGSRKTSVWELWRYLRSYLTVYLPRIRDLSPRTIDSYRQSISMYCSFIKEHTDTDLSKMSFDDLTRELVMNSSGGCVDEAAGLRRAI